LQISNLLVTIAIASTIGISQHAYALSLPSLDVSRPIFVNTQGERITQAAPSQPIEIVLSINNNVYDDNKSLMALIDVRDKDGVTIYLAWHSTRVNPNETYTFGVSWAIPNEAKMGSNYSARVFAITSLGDDAQVLSNVFNSEIEII
jgi:hypothetical protein